MAEQHDFERLERESEQLRLVLSLMAEGLVIVHEGGAIALANQTAGVMIRTAPEEIIGEVFKELFPIIHDSGSEVEPMYPVKKALEEDTIVRAILQDDWYLKRNDETRLPITLTATPFTSGHQKYVIVILRDSTQEKNIDMAKTEFVSLASHQLKTPLSSINWFTEMLLSGDAGKVKPKQRDYLNEVRSGAERMTNLVNELLNVSRIELGTFISEPEPTSLSELVKIVLKELAPQISDKEHNVVEDYAADVPDVAVDTTLMHIVLQNLLTNAVKYTPRSGTVRVSISKLDKDAVITIADSGLGIPEAQQNKIFSKFFRADNAVGSEAEGTGLGLYIIKSILEETGGSISFTSKEDKGTTFTLRIPLDGMRKKTGSRRLS